MKSQKTIEHYLITIQITLDVHLHAYLMTNDKRAIEHATNRMFDEAEKRGCNPLPIILQTTLSDGVKLVHKCLREEMPEAWKTQQHAKDYHLTIFGLSIDSPWDKRLMELH